MRFMPRISASPPGLAPDHHRHAEHGEDTGNQIFGDKVLSGAAQAFPGHNGLKTRVNCMVVDGAWFLVSFKKWAAQNVKFMLK